jgi:predicted restriction endonuclease
MWEIIINFLKKKTCTHDWEEIKEISVFNDDRSKRPVKRMYLYKCKNCGEFKQITMS